jgi:hypothetical protein
VARPVKGEARKTVRFSVVMTEPLSERLGRATVAANMSRSAFVCAVIENALLDLPQASDADLEAMEQQQDAAANWRAERGLR